MLVYDFGRCTHRSKYSISVALFLSYLTHTHTHIHIYIYTYTLTYTHAHAHVYYIRSTSDKNALIRSTAVSDTYAVPDVYDEDRYIRSLSCL